MNLIVNGQPKSVEGVETVADLLQHLDLDRRKVVVEVNEKIVRRDRVAETGIAEDDRVEILRFVGGG